MKCVVGPHLSRCLPEPSSFTCSWICLNLVESQQPGAFSPQKKKKKLLLCFFLVSVKRVIKPLCCVKQQGWCRPWSAGQPWVPVTTRPPSVSQDDSLCHCALWAPLGCVCFFCDEWTHACWGALLSRRRLMTSSPARTRVGGGHMGVASVTLGP